MKELDDVLKFLIDNRSDNRISISKKMKYGFRYYYISLSIDEEPDNTKTKTPLSFRFSDSLDIVVDNRNKCIEITNEGGTNNLIVEDEVLVVKWSTIVDDLLNEDLNNKVKTIFETTLSSCYNKNLLREYQMKKIIPK